MYPQVTEPNIKPENQGLCSKNAWLILFSISKIYPQVTEPNIKPENQALCFKNAWLILFSIYNPLASEMVSGT